jgi:tetratricopeptide (TPR) repeat protein
MTARWLRVIWPTVLLLVFATNLRGLSGRARPTDPSTDCDHLSPGDLAALERCVALRPSDVELLTDAGAAYEHAERWDRAEEAYRRAIAIDPQDGDVRVRLAEALLLRGDVEGARAQASAALAVQPGRAATLDLIRRSGGDAR